MLVPPMRFAAGSGLAVAAALTGVVFCATGRAQVAPPAPLRGGALWIAPPVDRSVVAEPDGLPIFRRSFTPRAKVVVATLFVSGLGQFEAHINGQNVTPAVLTPGWSDYRKRVYYDSYDVTGSIVPGENVIGVMLGNGMYNVESPKDRYTKFRGTFGPLKLIVELRLRFADGSVQSIVSDGAWKTAAGPITFSNIYGGEDYDAGREQAGWDRARFDDKGWAAVSLVDGPGGKLEPETIEPVIANETFRTVKVTQPKPGVAVYDLGQNFAGWPEISVFGPKGSSVRLLPGELLDANGLVTQRSMNAYPNDPDSFRYTLRGGGSAVRPESWHPRFSYTGFRYVQVETMAATADAGLPTVVSVDGRFLHDAVAANGHFSSSSDLLNRIHGLIDRAILSNMVSVLTDCPHREKLGWLEQTHLAGASLMYNYGLAGLYTKMGADIRDAQLSDGLVPDIAPEFPVFGGGFRDSPEWGAAAILSPWTAYQFYGDVAPLRDQYATMQRYAAYLKGKAKDRILAYGLGDWYDIGPKFPGVSQLTTSGVTGTATYYQSLVALVQIAKLLGHDADAAMYAAEAAEVKTAFNARFFHAETNRYDTGSQTAEAMPLVVGLVPEERRDAVLASLVEEIHAHGDHVTAGDVGFHYVVRALTDGGRSDVLYAMLSKTDKPSYGDQLAHGATSLTEAWDSNPASSQNHFMLGHAEEWFYRGLAGIDFDLSRTGDERIRIQPAVVGDLTSVSASYQSTLGEIASKWTRSGDTVRMEVTVPAGATAKILFPPEFRGSITLGDKPVAGAKGVLRSSLGNATPYCYVAGGTYRFELRR